MQRLLTLATALLLAIPSAASAATPAGGRADLTIASKSAKVFKRGKVKVSGSGGVTVSKTKILLPLTKSSDAEIAHAGGLKFKSGKRVLRITNLTLDRGQGLIYAVVSKQNVPFFLADLSKVKQTTDGGDTVISGVRVKLSAIGASVFASRVGVKIGTGSAFASAAFTIQSASTRVTLDPSFASALGTLGLSTAAQVPAINGSTLQFPITNAKGKITAKAPITHDGGLTFASATQSVTVGKFTIDPTGGVLYAEEAPSGRLALFTVDLSKAKVRSRGVQTVIAGARLTLHPDAAAALNTAFGTTALTAGLPVGTAAIVGLR